MAKNIAGVDVLVGRNGEEYQAGQHVRVKVGHQTYQGTLEFTPASVGVDERWDIRLADWRRMGPIGGSEIEGLA